MALGVCREYNSVLYSYKGWLIDKLCTPFLPPHHLTYPQTTPIGIEIRYRDGRWVRRRVCGGREWTRARQSPTLCRRRAQNYTCGKRAVPYSYLLYTVFPSVIFNSVFLSYYLQTTLKFYFRKTVEFRRCLEGHNIFVWFKSDSSGLEVTFAERALMQRTH